MKNAVVYKMKKTFFDKFLEGGKVMHEDTIEFMKMRYNFYLQRTEFLFKDTNKDVEVKEEDDHFGKHLFIEGKRFEE